jgi:hypothetical protein
MSRDALSYAARKWLRVLDERGGTAPLDSLIEEVSERYAREIVFRGYEEAQREGFLRTHRDDRVERLKGERKS